MDCKVLVKTYLKEIIIYANSGIVARHKRIDGFGEMQVDIFHYLNTLEKKPGAIKNSKALKSRATLKTIYDKYFSKRPKEFIELLKQSGTMDEEELAALLIRYGRNEIKYETASSDSIEDSIYAKTHSQISALSEMFLKGGCLSCR